MFAFEYLHGYIETQCSKNKFELEKYDYKKKNTETGQFYDIIQTRTKTHTIRTRKSRALQDAEKFVQMEKERLEKESSMFLQDADTKLQNATFINYKNKNVSLFDEPMKYSGALDLDGEMKNHSNRPSLGMCRVCTQNW